MKPKPTSEQKELLRRLPQVEEVLQASLVISLLEIVPRQVLVEFVRICIEESRNKILEGQCLEPTIEDITTQVCGHVLALYKPSLRKVINASGVVIHTNLGRSVLAKTAVDAVTEVAQGYSTLEYDPQGMCRGSRHNHYEQLVCALTGAEAALAVNNNAAAVMMVLSVFAGGKEAVVSRGELVEIGGSFRVPDIMKLSSALMVEVGTTNKTHSDDYKQAITQATSLLLKVHPSNFRLVGFTESVSIRDLRAIADKENAGRKATLSTQQLQQNHVEAQAGKTRGALDSEALVYEDPDFEVLVYEDQGSGALVNLECFGSYAEPTVRESLEQGCDLVSFSGDKLLGGPQAGIIVGKKRHIDQLKKHPLARALRLDKMSLAALEATLRLYLEPEEVTREIPTLQMLSASADEVKKRALVLRDVLKKRIATKVATIELVPEIARAGGGALPMCDINTYAVRIKFIKGNAQSCEEFLARKCPVPIVVRVQKEAVLCDARTLCSDDEIEEIGTAFEAYFALLEEGDKQPS